MKQKILSDVNFRSQCKTIKISISFCFIVSRIQIEKGGLKISNLTTRDSRKHLLVQSQQKNTGKRSEICSELTMKIPERRHLPRSGSLIVNFEYISHFFLVLLLPILNK